MTIKGNNIYVSEKEIEAANLGEAKKSELAEAIEFAGYELVIVNSDAR
jgi:hypothetical protein